MKKFVKLLTITLIVATVLALGSATALATDYEHCATALQAMGLFQGSDSGFQLDRAATRAEASVMLVRLLGAEQEALDSTYSHPFADVPDWASPYIGYMYEKGLTKGISATAFNPQGTCDLRMYCAFVLRALGYTEAAGDYTYAEAEAFAMNIGVADIINASGDFLRDNMAAISYTALFTPAKGTQNMLLEQLIEQEAVTTEAAQPYLNLYAAYAQMQSANAIAFSKNDIPLEFKLDMNMKMDMGEQGSANIVLDSLMQVDATAVSSTATVDEIMAALGKIKFAMTNKLMLSGDMVGEEQVDVLFNIYFLDSVVYVDNNFAEVLGDETVPAHLKLDADNLISLMGTSGVDFTEMMASMESITAGLIPADPYTPYYGISMIKSIKSESLSEGGQKLSLAYINMPNDMLTSIAGLMYDGMPEMMTAMEQINMNCEISDCTYTIDKDGNITAISMTFSMIQTMFAGTEEEMTASTDMQMIFEVTKTGAEVEIAVPDKTVEYVDLLEQMLGGTEGDLR